VKEIKPWEKVCLAIGILLTVGCLSLLISGCTDKPVVLPAGTAMCQQPMYGDDCTTHPGDPTSLPLIKNQLFCNLCQSNLDGPATGCAWVGSGNPDLWCVRDCSVCSSLDPSNMGVHRPRLDGGTRK
jgi:hypothetical protein